MDLRIKEARIAANLTQEQLAARLGVKGATLSGYETGSHDPKSNTLIKIARICGTTVDYLLGLDSSNVTNLPATDPALSPEALTVAHDYEGLDDFGKKAVRSVLDVEGERITHAKRRGETPAPAPVTYITIRRFTDPAAAGEPLYASSASEFVQYPAHLVPEGTDYAVGIVGDSMEPDYPDGCTVFVRSTQTIQDGDVVLAWLETEGGMVCKRAKVIRGYIFRLESINPEYESYTLRDLEGMRVYGKVLGYVMG